MRTLTWTVSLAVCLLSVATAAAQTVYDLEKRMLRADVRCGDYAATADLQSAVVAFPDTQGVPQLFCFNADQQSFSLVAGNAAASDWLKDTTKPIQPGRQDEIASAQGTVLARLDNALKRCTEMEQWLKGEKLPTPDRWLVFSKRPDEATFRAIVAYDNATGKGAISLAGQPQPLLMEHRIYESALCEFVCETDTSGLHIVGQRGALACDAGQVQLKLTGKWSNLVHAGSNSPYPVSRIRDRAAGPVNHVLHPKDRLPAAGEVDPLLIQVVMPTRANSPVDPLVWLLQP